MKRLLSSIVIALHVLTAVVALAAPKAPAPPEAPANPSAPAPGVPAVSSVKNINGSITIEKGQTVSDATAINGSVTVLGHVTGDATAVNGNVYLRPSAKVDGDATAVNGRVVKDPGAVLGGKTSSTNGLNNVDSEEGVHRVGNDVIVPKGETVHEATSVQGDVIVYGHVTSDATAVLGNVHVRSGGRVDGDATAIAGRVYRTGTGEIRGDVTSLDLGIPKHAWWSLPGGAWWTRHNEAGGWWVYLIYLGALVVIGALMTTVVIALFPNRMVMIAQCSLEKPGWSLLYGVLGAMLLLPIAVLLAITCVGIPLIAVEGVFAVLILIAGMVGFNLALGQKTGLGSSSTVPSAILAGVVGSCLITLLHLVPFIGGLIVWTLYLLGSGAVIMSGFGARCDWFASKFDKRLQSPAPAQPAVPVAPSAHTPETPPSSATGPAEGE